MKLLCCAQPAVVHDSNEHIRHIGKKYAAEKCGSEKNGAFKQCAVDTDANTSSKCLQENVQNEGKYFVRDNVATQKISRECDWSFLHSHRAFQKHQLITHPVGVIDSITTAGHCTQQMGSQLQLPSSRTPSRFGGLRAEGVQMQVDSEASCQSSHVASDDNSDRSSEDEGLVYRATLPDCSSEWICCAWWRQILGLVYCSRVPLEEEGLQYHID